jgi:hypothetical protein
MHCRRPLILTTVVAAAAMFVAGCGGGSSPGVANVGSSTSTSSPSSGLQPTQAQLQQGHQKAVRFVHCLRSHGVTQHVPDPTFTPASAFNAALSGAAQSPAFRSAYSACGRLLPSGQPSQRAAPSQAQIAALLAFARCLRSHGFPSFPDPTTSGQITHQMLASAGINVHQPAMLRAGDACVKITHGPITTATVARFVAGQ